MQARTYIHKHALTYIHRYKSIVRLLFVYVKVMSFLLGKLKKNEMLEKKMLL